MVIVLLGGTFWAHRLFEDTKALMARLLKQKLNFVIVFEYKEKKVKSENPKIGFIGFGEVAYFFPLD
ncbi:hypothetical protein DSCW_00780 [Desulfosarcina widdelii]|uniref:Uncharacterized protein n=1 Tax=Desulfosarcina widdelii TaxID=947919 RepID=A0A5K7YZQ2_9BACT|nr:hypothetical protein DSCW_00780 [Desulfosarcina widdelii]